MERLGIGWRPEGTKTTRLGATFDSLEARKPGSWARLLSENASREGMGYQPQGISPGFPGSGRSETAANAVRLMVFRLSLGNGTAFQA